MEIISNKINRFSSSLIFILAFVAYTPSLTGQFIWDDDLHVTQIEKLKSINGLKRIWLEPGATLEYYPLLFSTFWIERHLFGDNPFGYHLVNIFLHASNAVFLKQILIQLSIRGAPWAAAIFAVHPVHVESVAWITERKNCLSTFFYFLSLLTYLRFAGIRSGHLQTNLIAKSKNYFYAFIFFSAAVLSKTVACTFPAAILLLICWKEKGLKLKKILETLPFFIVGFFLAVITYRVETHFVGASGPEWEFHWTERFLIAGRALWFYIGKILWPQPLIFNYPRWVLDSTDITQIIFPFTFILFILFLLKNRRKWGSGPITGVLFFAGTLSPALGFIDFYWMRFSFVADHLQYPASAGIIAAITGIIASYKCKQWPDLKIIFPIILILLGTLTFKQIPTYQNNKSLWEDTILKNPSAWMAHNNIAVFFLDKNRNEEALKSLKKAIVLKPDEADINNSIGVALTRLGRYEEAIQFHKEAIKLAPNYPTAHFNLGVLFLRENRFPEALRAFNQELKIQSKKTKFPLNLGILYNNLGFTFLKLGQSEKAVRKLELAIRIQPDFAKAYKNLGFAYLQLGQTKNATKAFQKSKALQLNLGLNIKGQKLIQ